jgi:hypothetical protein
MLKRIALFGVVILLILTGCSKVQALPIPDTGTGIVTTEIRIGNFDPGGSVTIPVQVHYSIEGAVARELKMEYVDPGDTWETVAKFNLHQPVNNLDKVKVGSAEESDRPEIVDYDGTLNIKGFNPDIPQRQVYIEYPINPVFTLFFEVPDRLREGFEYPTQEQLNSWLSPPENFTMSPGETKTVDVTLTVPKGEVLPAKWAFFATLTSGIDKSQENGGMTINSQTNSAAWILVSKSPPKMWMYLGIVGIFVFFCLVVFINYQLNREKKPENEKAESNITTI